MSCARRTASTDASSYFGADPQIEIDKVTVDDNGGDGQLILVGDLLDLALQVTNDGNVALSGKWR